MDVAKFYDSLPMSILLSWFVSLSFPCKLVAAIFRHQLMAEAVVYLFGSGGLPGSRLAGALARVPIEDVVHHFQDTWKSLGLHDHIFCATWIDNLFVVSDFPHRAVLMLEQAEAFLAAKWQLTMKPDSKSLYLFRKMIRISVRLDGSKC